MYLYKTGVVVDDFRIRKSLPTIRLLQEKKAKIIIISHIEGGTDTLRPVYERLKQDIPAAIFCEDCLEEGQEYTTKLHDGDVLLCENLRLYDSEKKNDEEFAKKLASLGDIYVNDAFSVSHRKHASVVGIPKFLPGYLGLQFEEEVKNLSQVFNPKRPFVFVLGGAKFDTKLPLVQKFLPIADSIFIGGALANDFFKAKGWGVGTSLLSESHLDLSELVNNPKIMLPVDVVVDFPGGSAANARTVPANNIQADEAVSDDGDETLKNLQGLLSGAGCILWNGPLGNYEKGYKQQTEKLAKMIADTKAVSIVGGGDTLAAIASLNIEDKFSFVSTGGGAMLDFLANETLPGLEALKK